MATVESAPASQAVKPSAARGSLRAIAGLDALAVVGAMPKLVPGLGVWAGGRSGPFSLGLELQADAPDTARFAPGGQAALQLLAAGLNPCVYIGPFFVCAVGSVSWLQASGSDVAAPRSGSSVGVAAGPRAGLEFPIAGSFVLRARGDLLFNAVRPGVSMSGAEWSTPLFGGVFAAGAAYRFP